MFRELDSQYAVMGLRSEHTSWHVSATHNDDKSLPQFAVTCRSNKFLHVYWKIFVKILVSMIAFCPCNTLHKIKSVWIGETCGNAWSVKAHSETKLDFFVLYVLFLPFVTAGADGAKKLLREIVILPYLRPEVFLVVQWNIDSKCRIRVLAAWEAASWHQH